MDGEFVLDVGDGFSFSSCLNEEAKFAVRGCEREGSETES
jgi:hypothetical protein